MKAKLVAIAALLLASVYPSTASAESISTPGKIAPVTVAFTFTFDVGGFTNSKDKTLIAIKNSYYKVIADTATLYKELYSSILTTTQYGNRQLIADLINNEYLNPESKATDWNIVYVEAYGGEMSGFFAVSRRNSSVVFIGGYDQTEFPINLVSKDGSGYNESNTHTIVRDGMTTLSNTRIGAYKGVESYRLEFYPYGDTIFSANGLLYSQGTYNYDYTKKESNNYTSAPTTLSGLVGDDGDGTIIGGSLSIDALVNIKDASAYVTAYNNAHSG